MADHRQKVITYYNHTAIDYKTLWTGIDDKAMHYGYYDGPKQSHATSLLRMNEFLSSLVSIKAEDHVLDAGCGYGGSSMWLAQITGCTVAGVSIVKAQIDEANAHAQQLNLTHKAHFFVQDYTQTDFPDESFSVVWGLESIVHCEDKQAFIREAYRLLKPHGRLLIAEYMLRDQPPLNDHEHEQLQPWLNGWAMPNLLSPGSYLSLLKQTGFESIQTNDITQYIRPSSIRMKRLSRIGLPIATILKKFKLFSQVHYDNVHASLVQAQTLQQGLWTYTVITAEKP